MATEWIYFLLHAAKASTEFPAKPTESVLTAAKRGRPELARRTIAPGRDAALHPFVLQPALNSYVVTFSHDSSLAYPLTVPQKPAGRF